MDAYYAGLPGPTKNQMPSLREWYDKLSDALHSAREDQTLFNTAKTEIERHFDIRRVFNIPEPSTAKLDEKQEDAKTNSEAQEAKETDSLPGSAPKQADSV